MTIDATHFFIFSSWADIDDCKKAIKPTQQNGQSIVFKCLFHHNPRSHDERCAFGVMISMARIVDDLREEICHEKL